MKGLAVKRAGTNEKKQSVFFQSLKCFVLKPIETGLIGFATFFTILIITKYLSYLIGTVEEFIVDIEDLILSAIGFILMFLIKFLENFKKEEA